MSASVNEEERKKNEKEGMRQENKEGWEDASFQSSIRKRRIDFPAEISDKEWVAKRESVRMTERIQGSEWNKRERCRKAERKKETIKVGYESHTREIQWKLKKEIHYQEYG